MARAAASCSPKREPLRTSGAGGITSVVFIFYVVEATKARTKSRRKNPYMYSGGAISLNLNGDAHGDQQLQRAASVASYNYYCTRSDFSSLS